MSTHAYLQKKHCQSLEEGSWRRRQEAVFAVCLGIDRDINEVMQLGSILTLLHYKQYKPTWGKSQKQIKSY